MSNFRKILTIAALLGCTFSMSAQAAPQGKNLFSYNFAQVSFVDVDFPGSSYDGFELAGSYAVDSNLALIGSYLTTDNQASNTYDLLAVGIAYHSRFNQLDRADFVLHGEFLRSSFGNVDDTGIRFGAMLRNQVEKNLEFFADISHVDINNNTDLALTPGVVLSLNDKLSAVFSYQLSDNDTLAFGVRFELD